MYMYLNHLIWALSYLKLDYFWFALLCFIILQTSSLLHIVCLHFLSVHVRVGTVWHASEGCVPSVMFCCCVLCAEVNLPPDIFLRTSSLILNCRFGSASNLSVWLLTRLLRMQFQLINNYWISKKANWAMYSFIGLLRWRMFASFS